MIQAVGITNAAPVQKKYLMIGGSGVDCGFLLDWEKYCRVPWWRRVFAQNSCTLANGPRKELRDLVDKMNADLPNALAILDKWKERYWA